MNLLREQVESLRSGMTGLSDAMLDEFRRIRNDF